MTANQEYPPNEGPTEKGNGNGCTSAVIELVLTPELERKQIVTTCSYNFKSKSIQLKLNHIYQNMWIDSPVNLEYWNETNEEFDNNLEDKGVTTEDRTQLGDMLNLNHEIISKHFAEQTLEETSAGQRKRKERNDRIRNTPPRDVSVSQALMMHEGNVRIIGMFVGGSAKVEKMHTKIGFRCGNCYEPNILADYSERPRLQSEIPHVFTPKHLSKQECKICYSKSIEHEPYEELVSALRVELRDEETSNDPPNIDVILFNVRPNDVRWNEPIKIAGSVQRVIIKDKISPHVFVDGINHIEHVEEIESTEITPDDEKKIQEFLNKNNPRILDALAELVESSHIGDKDAKKGVLMCAANTGTDIKRRINVCFLGETGLAKTALAKGATRLVLGSKFASAMDSTTNSLICVVDGDTGHFRFGPIVTANNAICVVDEVGRMPREEQARLLSAMGPDGTVYFGRFGITRELPASAGFILTANPDSISGKFRYPDKIDPNEFPFLGPFRDRIDLVFIFRANRDPSYLRKYGYSKFEDEDNRTALLKKEGENYQFLRKWILYGKEIGDIKFSAEAECVITEYFTNIMISENSQSSNRLHDTLRKCCIAIARLKLKDIVDAGDAREVIELYDKQLKYWSQIDTNIPLDPRDLAYQEIVKKLTGQKFKSEFIELLQAVCKDNVSVDRYTMKIDKETGKRVWDIENNKHVRYIHDKFTQGPRDERILILGTSPLTLAWDETYQGGDKDTAAVIDSNSGPEGTKSVTDHSDQTDRGRKDSDEENGRRTDQLASSIQLQDENSNSQNGQNGQLGNRDLGGSNNIASDNGIPKVADKDPLEDYEAGADKRRRFAR